jgi:hypothetical protein
LLTLALAAGCGSDPPRKGEAGPAQAYVEEFRERADGVFEGTRSCRRETMRAIRAFLENREEDGHLSQAKDVEDALTVLKPLDPVEFAAAYAELRDFALYMLSEASEGALPPLSRRVWEMTAVGYVLKHCPVHESARLFTLILRSHPKPGWPPARSREIFERAKAFSLSEPFDATGFVLNAEVGAELASSALVRRDPALVSRLRRVVEQARGKARESTEKWRALPPSLRPLSQELREAVLSLKMRVR